MLKMIKSSLFKFCIALFALAALNMLIPVVNAQEPAQSGAVNFTAVAQEAYIEVFSSTFCSLIVIFTKS